MDDLLRSLKKLTCLPEADLTPVLHYFIPSAVPGGTMLLIPGAQSPTVWFVGNGFLRAFYQIEEKKRTRTAGSYEKHLREITNWIVPEGGFLTDIRSFLQQIPSKYYIEALEPCRLYSLSRANYLTIQKLHPDINHAIFENTLIMADLRIEMCNLRDAAARLEMFEDIYPVLKGRLSVNVQASYLNIDPTTLSRLRGKK